MLSSEKQRKASNAGAVCFHSPSQDYFAICLSNKFKR
ncbi:hypothetical protein SLEP1_g37061 [Rubroshorea leprosula]|uniref:Uncharacterized protein n=1 Tax=Rubroshorea leprosula TaxID=152421 RepID=A0AAV5KTI1_9ROSI|nr:hypothetical protein SLEP1_g37061 [Rubroshorea leprosula]